MRTFIATLGVVTAILAVPCDRLLAQTPPFSINPMRMEMEVGPGAEKTAAFEIKAASSATRERGRLLLSLTDWDIREDGSVLYADAGSLERSASKWIIFSPAALTIEPDRVQLVRLTVSVPENTPPGTYQAGVFVQERPEATPPKADQRLIAVRVRFAFTLYVIVPPAFSHPELVNIEAETVAGHLRLTCEMNNKAGARHVRPVVIWTIRRGAAAVVEARGRLDSTVLLAFSRLREPYSLPHDILEVGDYEVEVLVDFQDGRPMQSMAKVFSLQPGPRN